MSIINLTEEKKKAIAREIGISYTKNQNSFIWTVRQFLFKFFEKLELKKILSEQRKHTIGQFKKVDNIEEKIAVEEDKLVRHPVMLDPNNVRSSLLKLTGSPEEQKALCLKLEASYKKITGKEAEKINYKDGNKLPEYLKETLFIQIFPCIIIYFRFDNEEQQNEFKKMANSLLNQEKVENTQNPDSKLETPQFRFR